MKVLHLNYSDLNGGAAKAAYRLHSAQRKCGIDSYMLVTDKFGNDKSVFQVDRITRIKIKLSGYLSRILLKRQKSCNSVQHSINILPTGVLKIINDLSPDIVNIHWVGLGMISFSEISKIKPKVVWTQHDMWSFSGCEHYSESNADTRYKEGYTKASRSNCDSGFDLNRLFYKIKEKKLRPFSFITCSPSKWLMECTSNSYLLSGHQNKLINNCVDHSFFKPVNACHAKDILGLNTSKKYICFGAMSSTSDPRKGYKYLIDALQTEEMQRFKSEYEIIVFGADSGDLKVETGFDVSYLGILKDEYSLVLAYNAADLFVAPSLQDNLPNTVVESLACGTPVVAFNIGGMPDLIRNGFSGFLCENMHYSDLSSTISYALTASYDKKAIHLDSKEKRDESVVVKNYFEIYR